MCVETFEKDRDRTLLRNIAYAGSLAALLKIDTDRSIEAMLTEKFGKKPKLLAANHTAFKLGYDYAMAHFQCPLPFHLEPMDRTGDSILIDGNTAAALGAVYAGATVGAWYPITPATALMEQFKGFCEKYRVDKETGLHKYAILQAEDELAAAGIIIGAGWAGARAFTNTSGPGISLMQEFIGLAYYTDIPAVFIDVQRCGPATGMPTRTQQADLSRSPTPRTATPSTSSSSPPTRGSASR
jgi:2-oxoglutarate ferredoxin oxidoreductase subunit alpha